MTQAIYKDLDKFLEDDPEEKELKTKIDELVYKGTPATRTISSRYSLIKTYLRKTYDGLSDDFLKSVKPPEEIIKALLSEDAERRQAKTNFNFSQEDVEKILELKESENAQDQAIYLQFISGRRASEIYQHKNDHDLIELTRVRNKPELIKFSALHKKKGDDKAEIVRLIPDSLDSKQFKQKYNKLRVSLGDISTQDSINRVNKRLKELFPKKRDMSSHKLRGMYARYMYEEFNKDDQNINGFITDILNHDSPESSLSYSGYKYTKTPILKPDRKIKKKE